MGKGDDRQRAAAPATSTVQRKSVAAVGHRGDGYSNTLADETAARPGTSPQITTAPGRADRTRPRSPNIQVYRPQLTSVLSIANRITGVLLAAGAVGLVAWLFAAASGPQAYESMRAAMSSWPGRIVLFGFTFAFFLHFCGGIRHLVWDTVHGFELRSIYLGGWAVVAASVVLTLVSWVASSFVGG